MALLEGIKVKLAGRDFTVPSLNMKGIRLLGPKLVALTENLQNGAKVMDPGTIGDMLEIIHAAMVRNYPELTMDELEDMVDLSNLEPLFSAVCGQSNLKQKDADDPEV